MLLAPVQTAAGLGTHPSISLWGVSQPMQPDQEKQCSKSTTHTTGKPAELSTSPPLQHTSRDRGSETPSLPHAPHSTSRGTPKCEDTTFFHSPQTWEVLALPTQEEHQHCGFGSGWSQPKSPRTVPVTQGCGGSHCIHPLCFPCLMQNAG